MRSMPRMKVFSAINSHHDHKILEHCVTLDRPSYIRVARNEVPELYQDNFSFVEGAQ